VILFSLCNTCLQAYQILVETSDIELIKQVASDDGMTCKCPRLCGGRINLVGDDTIEAMSKDPRLREPMNISGKELYQAVNGLGLPDEVPKSIDTVSAILRANKVRDFDLGEVAGKLYLHELRLEGGITLHLSSGPFGAQVLKMTKERSNGSGNPG
jgi:hypothetical protein